MEDELRNQYSIDVRILDRNWIIKQIYENEREDIVNEELRIELITEAIIKKGPLDLRKIEDLSDIDKGIELALSKNMVSISIVDNAITSAILSRELEKPRVEIDGRFDRAERLAQDFGNTFQRFEVVYQYAWTTFWWYEDFPKFVQLYQTVEERVINTEHIYNLERLTTLWLNLYTIRNQVDKGKEIVGDDFFKAHTQVLKKKLTNISEEKEDKPNAALYARSLLLEIELIERRLLGEEFSNTLNNLKKVVDESKLFPLQV